MKKRRLKKKTIIAFLIVIFIIIISISLVFLIPKKSSENSIIGSWITLGGTIYEFNENNQGTMIVPLAEYKFTYEINDNKLSIDYESEKANDAEYEYSINDNELVLKGKRGTFTFTKNK